MENMFVFKQQISQVHIFEIQSHSIIPSLSPIFQSLNASPKPVNFMARLPSGCNLLSDI